ncbi:helix-turn-helix domain-containing protein [Streptomyces gardneri]|nr:helix-turn-helix domain-containing protein [Streptomyces gardneri]
MHAVRPSLDITLDRALEVIKEFDALLVRGATIDTVLRTAASRAGCIAGLWTTGALDGRTAAPDGTMSRGTPGPSAATCTLGTGGVIWLERDQLIADDLDALILDRMDFVATVTLRSMGSAETALSEAALIEVTISATADEADRARALRMLGYSAAAELRVLTCDGSRRQLDSVVEQLRAAGRRVHTAEIGALWVILVDGDLPETLGVPIGVRLATSPKTPGITAPRAWMEAGLALEFALPSTRHTGPYRIEEAVILESNRIGCVTLLAQHIPMDAMAEAAEVVALDKLAGTPGGTEMLRTLEAVAATESLRRAASTIHMHHNSVRTRVERAEQLLDFQLTEPYGRVRLMTALTLRRLRDAKLRARERLQHLQ